MTGKQKCRILKEIRRQIAEQNDIRFVIEECTHKGKCRGTCPKCEWEVRMLERELEKRRSSGKKVVLAGISAGFLLTSCSPIDAVKDLVSSVTEPLQGDMLAETTSGSIAETFAEEVVPEPLEGEPAVPEVEITEGELPVWEVEIEEGEVDLSEEDDEIPVDEPVIEGELVFEGDILSPAPDEGEQP